MKLCSCTLPHQRRRIVLTGQAARAVARRVHDRKAMQTPLQVRFHGLPPSQTVARAVAHRARELEADFPRIVSCRVSIALPHRHRQQGRRFRVRVDLGIPGLRAVAGRAADEDPAHEDVHVAIRDAFRAARRQLEQHQTRGEILAKETP